MNSHITRHQVLRFIVSTTFLHVLTYFVVGSLAYLLIYDSAITAGGFDSYMRTPNDPLSWRHVEIWVVPAQFARGLLFALALTPFLGTLSAWSWHKRFGLLFFVLVNFCILNASMPAEGSIEGWVYLLPAVGPQLQTPILGYIEVPVQLALFSALVSWRTGRIMNC